MTGESRAVVIAHVRQQHVAQMAFAKYHDMISCLYRKLKLRPVCTENLIGVDAVMETPKLAE